MPPANAVRARPRVLLVAPRVPYPPVGGEFQKNHQLIRILSHHFDVTYVALEQAPLGPDAHAFLSSHTVAYSLHRVGRLRCLLGMLGAVLSLKPLQVGYFHCAEMMREVRRLAGDADLVYCVLIRTAQYGLVVDRPRLLDMADLLSINYASTARSIRSRLAALAYRFESWLLARYERRAVGNFDVTTLFNPDEVARLRTAGNVRHVPHGVNPALLGPCVGDPSYADSIVFLGKMDYQPNIDAAVWFAERVMPLLPAACRFVIVGTKPAAAVQSLQDRDPRVQVTGYIDDFVPIVKGALCVVAPMQSGSGIQNKVLEAMALGTINLVTSITATPLQDVAPGRDLIVEDDPARLALAIEDIMRDPAAYDPMKRAAREYILANYSWARYEEALLEIIRTIDMDRACSGIPVVRTLGSHHEN